VGEQQQEGQQQEGQQQGRWRQEFFFFYIFIGSRLLRTCLVVTCRLGDSTQVCLPLSTFKGIQSVPLSICAATCTNKLLNTPSLPINS
jgi:hypothetical protein